MNFRKPSTSSGTKQPMRRTPKSATHGNSTFMNDTISTHNKARTHLNLNSTNILFPSAAPANSDSKGDVAYSEFLIALMDKQILCQTVDSFKMSFSDQLECNRETISRLEDEKFALESEISNIEMNEKLERDVDELKALLQESDSVLNKNIKKQIGKFVEILDIASNRLNLDRVEPLKSEDEHRQFERLVKRVNTLLETYKSIESNAEATEKLARCLSKNTDLFEEAIQKSAQLKGGIQKDTVVLLLEKVSDIFASTQSRPNKSDRVKTQPREDLAATSLPSILVSSCDSLSLPILENELQ